VEKYIKYKFEWKNTASELKKIANIQAHLKKFSFRNYRNDFEKWKNNFKKLVLTNKSLGLTTFRICILQTAKQRHK
jgi:hypothetical protein